jgi:hypothetical protein
MPPPKSTRGPASPRGDDALAEKDGALNTAPHHGGQELALARDLRRGLRRGAVLDERWFDQHHNQCRVARLRQAIKGEAEALVVVSDLPKPQKNERILVIVVRIGEARIRKALLLRGKLPPLDREDLALAAATSSGLVSLAGLEHKAAMAPHRVQ